ncbi:polysaccharide pyruvyl transferase family protein [Maribacter ulvicola]|uniref:Polysaccharide pyruvyl transferase n=1 Tax=Maribacter ulvicola TaxID=228959 RepID=A0A1N6PJ34_9FLAO|nr:polysaccharide pyruvyl transferase family protein [Maribacter ulvicola]SIQ04306.1 Polysaccharide pyruvyl transferase [Maribacter ulvicola]
MKIALITIHRVTNYGAILQAFATKVVLSKYGDVTTIDYKNRFLTRHMDYVRFEPSFHGLKMTVHDILNFRSRFKLIRKFENFLFSNMNLSKTMDKTDLESGKANGFDIYVCGSDQIWNPRIISRNTSIDPIFFLSFVDNSKTKFSYASSIGNHEYSEEENKIITDLLFSFNSISTREKNGVNKLNNLVKDKEIHHVLDPTLLFDKQEWMNIFSVKKSNITEKYILVYSVPRTELLKKAIKYYRQILGYKVVSVDKVMLSLPFVDTHVKDAGPKEFIEIFSNASFVITDSFHGTCFALNFQIPFACIYIENKTNRQESLLGQLQVGNRIIYKEEDFSNLTLNQDFSKIEMEISKLRKASLDYIDRAFN